MNTNQIYNKMIGGLLGCFLVIVPCLLSSCESWVDVTPDDRIVETTVFERQQGYQKALNGLYGELTSSSLYGRSLSVEAIDVMAHIYNQESGKHNHEEFYKYQYTTDKVKGVMSAIWEKGYNMITNANAIIEHAAEADCPLSELEKNRIVGEALAVRAFMHFDLLRLFGPLTSQLSERAIPYQTSSRLEVIPFESGQQILTKIKTDLSEAIRLLEKSEPLLLGNSYEANDLDSRPYRMNYFAAKAVLARVYLWEGDKTNALKEATEVINNGEKYFPASTGGNDCLFSSEMLFGLYDVSRQSHVHNTLFSSALSTRALLTVKGSLGTGRLKEWYDDQNDYRYKIWVLDVVDGNEVTHHQKFKDVTTTTYQNYTMPLIRMGEMYLIAAECASNITDGARYINVLRNRRNCFTVDINESNLRNYLTLEYRKEMLGEGQLFFYFKRIEASKLPRADRDSGDENMSISNYVAPIPDSERSMREDFDN